jgi:cell division control protein 12
MIKLITYHLHFVELEEKMFKVKLTIIDTPGFGDYVNNRHGWIPIVDFIDDQHEKYMRQEQQPCRKGVVDMRVHACLYFIKPTGHTYVNSIFLIYLGYLSLIQILYLQD